MKRDSWKRLTALMLCLLMTVSLVACGNSNSDTPPPAPPNTPPAENNETSEPGEETPAEPAFVVADNDEDIYFNAYGDFYDAYQKAMEAKTVSERHALLAVAEAKALETGVGTPMYGPVAGYVMQRFINRSGGYAPWRGTRTDMSQYVYTNEIITAEDHAKIKEILNETLGTGTYIEKAKEYLAGKGYTFADSVTATFVDNATTWNMFTASTSNDSSLISPTLDYLYVYDAEGQLVPHLATGYEVSEDGLTYTIHIREGINWVDSQGRKVAELTADDWVAAAQHLGDVQDYYTLGLYVKGMTEYGTGETTDFNDVGVKAVDKYTLEYTMIKPTTYFQTMWQSTTFLPLCRSYFLSQGGAFGVAEYAEASAAPGYSYGIDQNHIPYCGQFICTNVTEKNSVNYELNPEYWNADNMTVKSFKLVYDDGTDNNRGYTDFMNGLTNSFFLRTSHLETAKANGDFDKYVTTSDTGRATFLFWFNLHRQTYANMADGAAPSNKTDAQKELSCAALQNKHFRLAVGHAIDRASYISQSVGEDLKSISIRNTMTPGTYVALEEDTTIDINGTSTTFPAGTWYGEIVQAQLTADEFPVTVWDAERMDTDGWDAWYNPELAAEELAIAIEELKSIGYEVSAENPIVVDYPYPDYNEVGQNQAYVLKTSIQNALGDCVKFDLIPLNNATEFLNVQNNTNNGSEINYDIGGLGTIGSDHGDPQCYTEGLLPYGDGRLTRSKMGLW